MTAVTLLYRYFICNDSTSLHLTGLPLSSIIRVNWLLRVDTADHRRIYTDPAHLQESTDEHRHAPVSIFHMRRLEYTALDWCYHSAVYQGELATVYLSRRPQTRLPRPNTPEGEY
jgi:hypothetical protein